MSSSVRPSLKKSWSGLPLRFWKGRTANRMRSPTGTIAGAAAWLRVSYHASSSVVVA